eukprot:5487858-Pleurochrysis_carterae.AAC.1
MADSACPRTRIEATAQARPVPASAPLPDRRVLVSCDNSHFPPALGCSLQVDPGNNQNRRHTLNEGVLRSERASLNARSDRAVASGGTAVNYLMELPGLGKFGGAMKEI